MADKRKIPRLGSAELEILAMLWRRGPLTLAEAHRSFGDFGQPVGYTTMQTRLNRLVAKGAVDRTRQRPAEYRAAVDPHEVSARHMRVLLDKVSGGSIVPLVAQLISGGTLSREEIRELKQLIAEAEASGRQDCGKDDKR